MPGKIVSDISITVNYKTYVEGMGLKGLQITDAARVVSSDTGIDINVAPPLPETALHAGRGVPVFSQHCDAVEAGSDTGFVLPESLKAAGASGTLLNHSEHRMRLADIAAAVVRCRPKACLAAAG